MLGINRLFLSALFLISLCTFVQAAPPEIRELTEDTIEEFYAKPTSLAVVLFTQDTSQSADDLQKFTTTAESVVISLPDAKFGYLKYTLGTTSSKLTRIASAAMNSEVAHVYVWGSKTKNTVLQPLSSTPLATAAWITKLHGHVISLKTVEDMKELVKGSRMLAVLVSSTPDHHAGWKALEVVEMGKHEGSALLYASAVGAAFASAFEVPPNSMVIFKEDHEKEILDLGPFLRNRGPTAESATATAVTDFIKNNAMPLIYDVTKGLLALPPGVLKKHSTYIFMFGVQVDMHMYELARSFKRLVQFVNIPKNGPKKIMDFFQVTGREDEFPILMLTVGHHARLNLDVVTDKIVSIPALRMLLDAYTSGGFGTLKMFIEDQDSKVSLIDNLQTLKSLDQLNSAKSSPNDEFAPKGTPLDKSSPLVVFFTPEDLPGSERQLFDKTLKSLHIHGQVRVAVGEEISKAEKVKEYAVVVYRDGTPHEVWDHFGGEDLMDAIIDTDDDPASAASIRSSTVPSNVPLSEFLEVALVPNVIDVAEAKIPQGLLQPSRPILIMFTSKPPDARLQKLAKQYKQKLQFVRFHKSVRHALGLKLGIPLALLQVPELVCVVEVLGNDHKVYMLENVLEDVADGKEKDVNIKVMSEQLGKFMKGELAPSTLEDFHSKSEL